jgi:serine/threonine-protein kinase
MTFSPGDNVGTFRIIEPLGQGGMATVYKAYHAALDRYVAIKVLHPAFKQDPNFIARFNREARIVARLDHPNIIPIFDFAEQEGTPFLVMRYVEGKTLKAIMRDTHLPIDRVLSVMRPVTAALAYAHDQNVLHRDLKPSNIMLTNDGHVFLADFGLARIAQAGDSTLSKDMLIGTPQYISPEQAQGLAVDERSDLYSLGVVLYEMLTGRVPFSADTPYAVIHDHIYSPLPLPRSINPNLSPDLERVLLKALDKDPRARFATASDLMQALETAAAVPNANTNVTSTVIPAPTPIAPSPSIVSPAPSPMPSTMVYAPIPSAASASLATPVPAPIPVAKPASSSKTGLLIAAGIVGFLIIAALVVGIVFVAVQRKNEPPQVFAPFVNSNPQQPDIQNPKILATPVNPNPPQPGTLNSNPPKAQATLANPNPTQTGAQLDAQLKAARDAVAKNPNDVNARLTLANALAATKNYDDAFKEYDLVIKSNPKLVSAYGYAGTLAQSLGDFDRAINYFKNGITQNPSNIYLYLSMSDVFVQEKKYDQARTALDQALKIDGNSAQAYWRIGDLDRLQGKPAQALISYGRAAAIDPDLPEAHYSLGQLALLRNQKDEAIRQFQMVVNNPNTSAELKNQAAGQLAILGVK